MLNVLNVFFDYAHFLGKKLNREYNLVISTS
jgi:hypothetical protein